MPNILIVDDEPVELAILQEILTEEGFQLRTASNGQQAKKILENHPDQFQAVLLDWVMPKMTGLELLQWIKGHPDLSNIEVVLQSGKIGIGDAEKGIENGAYYYLTKPAQIPQLKAVMRAAVSNCLAKTSLTAHLRKTEDAFKLLVEGRFELQTLPEAESLAVGIAATCATCQRALGLFELLVNAVEHGNLGITYEEKSRLLQEGSYEKEVARRLELPENQDKKVEVELRRTMGSVDVSIQDQGPGFDYQDFLEFDPKRLYDSHGRGIFLANSMLDIEYVDPGNQVRVKIPTPQRQHLERSS